jgi:hypothetical protein
VRVCHLDQVASGVLDIDIKTAFKDFFKDIEVLFNTPDHNVTILGRIQIEADPFAVGLPKAGVSHVTGLTAIKALGQTQQGGQAPDNLL